MSIKFVVIIQCDIARKRCSGFACTKSFYQTEDFFENCGYDDSVRYLALTCGGCSGTTIASYLEHFSKKLAAKMGIKKEEVAVHLSSCMVTDNYHHDRCPHLEYIKSIIIKKGFSNITDGTFKSESATAKRAAGIYKNHPRQNSPTTETQPQ